MLLLRKRRYFSHQVLTKYRVLDRQYPISEVNPLPKHIENRIPVPPPANVDNLHHCAAQESTTEEISIRCNCRHGIRHFDVYMLK